MRTTRDPFSPKIQKYPYYTLKFSQLREWYFRVFGLKGSRAVHMTQFLLELTA